MGELLIIQRNNGEKTKKCKIILEFNSINIVYYFNNCYYRENMINHSKYKNLILYLLKKMDRETLEGKKKICKLLYFIDFGAFEKYGSSITNDEYVRMPMGPKPNNAEKIIADLEKNGYIEIRGELKHPAHEYETQIYRLKKNPNLSIFSAQEKNIIDWVISIYSKLSGKELENISHSEAPWLAVKRNGEKIPYELSYYRGTEF